MGGGVGGACLLHENVSDDVYPRLWREPPPGAGPAEGAIREGLPLGHTDRLDPALLYTFDILFIMEVLHSFLF